MAVSRQVREKRFQLFGWMLFLVCSVLFIIGSIDKDGPYWLAGSILFLVGCVVFLIPFFLKRE